MPSNSRNKVRIKTKKVAKTLYHLGIDIEKIAKEIGYSVETVKE